MTIHLKKKKLMKIYSLYLNYFRLSLLYEQNKQQAAIFKVIIIRKNITCYPKEVVTIVLIYELVIFMF